MDKDDVAEELTTVRKVDDREHVVTLYVVLGRWGQDYWSALSGTHKTLEDARRSVRYAMHDGSSRAEVYRIMRVDGLPIGMPEGGV